MRRRGKALYAAAGAAKLDRCGRGGNAIAERATFVDYRQAYVRIDERTIGRIASIDDSATALTKYFVGFRAVTREARRQYRATGRMRPPRELRRLHQAVRRSYNALLETRDLLTPAATRGQAVVLFARIGRDFARYERIERRLRRQLNR